MRTIGLLDIYGFEIFERNSFEHAHQLRQREAAAGVHPADAQGSRRSTPPRASSGA